jgi:adenine-specific DNA methylase
MITWGDLFTQRQHIFLSLLAERVTVLGQSLQGRDAETIQAILALTVARLADHLNSGCRWNPTGEKLQQLFARQAVPMVWDFCEANPLGGSVGDWLGIVEGAADALAFVPSTEIPGEVLQASAAECPLPDDSIDAVITDPPYYDAVPYADLSEFFYVWLRRCAPRSRASWFAKPLVDRSPEIVFDTNRGKDASFYVRAMTAALNEARRVTRPNGIGVIVFAHKSTAGWEALLQAVLDAGWVITASWPIDTELATRVRAMGSATGGHPIFDDPIRTYDDAEAVA